MGSTEVGNMENRLNLPEAFVIPSKACVEATYLTLYGTAPKESADPTLTIDPRPKFLSRPLVMGIDQGSCDSVCLQTARDTR